uniref:Uncharacterized protein n=1 Tax=Quercus lobata TaxID=97700 RepID=A0A7N2M2M2_QUELO
MVRSAWTCLIALQLPVLETGAAVFIDDLSEKDLDGTLWKCYSEAAEAAMVLVVTGFSRCLVQYDKPDNPGYRVAYGISAEVEEHPFDETSLVALPRVPSKDIKERMVARLRHLGIKVKKH